MSPVSRRGATKVPKRALRRRGGKVSVRPVSPPPPRASCGPHTPAAACRIGGVGGGCAAQPSPSSAFVVAGLLPPPPRGLDPPCRKGKDPGDTPRPSVCRVRVPSSSPPHRRCPPPLPSAACPLRDRAAPRTPTSGWGDTRTPNKTVKGHCRASPTQ